MSVQQGCAFGVPESIGVVSDIAEQVVDSDLGPSFLIDLLDDDCAIQ